MNASASAAHAEDRPQRSGPAASAGARRHAAAEREAAEGEHHRRDRGHLPVPVDPGVDRPGQHDREQPRRRAIARGPRLNGASATRIQTSAITSRARPTIPSSPSTSA